MANRLADETSPYLLQHADNPVDWYPWGQEALGKARTQDKPIFLSIGYSACHWCHVMERESFEDERIAAFLNQRFVSIKVDREERPDLDAVYMSAVQALTGRGGWPLSVWLTPDGAPFFGGTYFPPTARQGMPSFLQVLEAVSQAWDARRADLHQTADALLAHVAGTDTPAGARRGAGAESVGTVRSGWRGLLDAAASDLHRTADRTNGGWGGAPKFPPPMVLEYLLARQTVKPEPGLQVDIEVTLDAMAAGGIYDHLGGGFHRYATDGYWLVPHFEKMLYDNAQLARCYLHAWQLLGKSRYRTVATETLDYLLREMRHPGGGFFSAQDADTAEGEGAYFGWTLDEVRRALAPAEADLIERTYGLTAQGNFEGRNLLHLSAAGKGADQSPALAAARARLLQVRETRPRPARDEKVITSWNGLALAAFAEAAACLDSPVYREAAVRAGEFVLGELGGGLDGARLGGAALVHSWKDGRSSGPAFLDDYACVAEGLLALYGCTFDERWFVAARALVDEMAERFARPAGGFYDTSLGHENLITRPRATYDSPTPTGTSMAAAVLLKTAAYTGEDRYRRLAEEALDSLADEAAAAPVMAGQWLSAALLAEEGATEVAIVGDLADSHGRALVGTFRDGFRPLAVVAARPSDAASRIPLLHGREPAPGVPAMAWVCRRSTCAPPVTEPTGLSALLAGPASAGN
jgi:uncharacterized protein